MGKNSKWIIAAIAAAVAVVGVMVAIGAYFKKKARVIGDDLDYDEFYDEDYFDEANGYECCEKSCCCSKDENDISEVDEPEELDKLDKE